MNPIDAGTVVDGFTIDECIHAGETSHIYRVHVADGQAAPDFAMAMKVPRQAADDGAHATVRFEIECQMLRVLQGSHVPRFVAVGDLSGQPYLVMEYVSGRTLAQQMETDPTPDVQHIASLGSAMARAAHALHQQNAVHLGLKPSNILFRDDGSAVLLGLDLACHAHYPDLLADQLRTAIGSPAWMAPEQVLGVRGDPRSDVFAIGVMLYQLCTGQLPFGAPPTTAGLRQRLWVQPVPPRKIKALMPEWLQEVVMRCLEPVTALRYPSAAHLAFDLSHPTQVTVTARGRNTRGTGFGTHIKRRLKAAAMHYKPSLPPAQQVDEVPIVMVAVPYQDATDTTLRSLRQAAGRALGVRPGARLACVTVVAPALTSNTPSDGTDSLDNKTQRHQLNRLRQWSQPLDLPGHQTSCHVFESGDVAQTLLQYASKNAVSVIILGAATHGLEAQQFTNTLPIRVAMDAPCTVILVKQTSPSEQQV